MAQTFPPHTALRASIDAGVDEYFERTGLSRFGDGRLYAKSVILLLFLAASYVGLVFFARGWWQAAPLAVALGFGMAGVGFNIQHDGNHGAYSARRGINRLMGFSIDLVGGASYYWNFKHNIQHHTYPNVSGADDDIYMGLLARLSPHDRRLWFHRFQHLYIWLLYTMLTLKWQLVDDFRTLIVPTIGDARVPRPRGWDRARFVAGKVIFFSLAFVVPLSLHPVRAFLPMYLLVNATAGLLLATVFQSAHCLEEAAFPYPAAGAKMLAHEWTRHQLETTVDFARGSRVVTWFLGGLNFQVEHHLFPRISHVHYPALSPIIEKVCTDNGVRHLSHPTMRAAVRSHYRWVRRMGQPDAALAAVDAVAA